jgi:predicted Zn-dependent protease
MSKRPRGGSDRPLFFDADFKPCLAAFQRRDWTEAELLMGRISKRSPQSSLALTMLASIQAGRAEFRKAQATVERALRLEPDNGMAYLLKGTCFAQRGRVAEGVTAVRKSLEIGLPDQGTLTAAWEFLARAEYELGNTNHANEALRNLENLDSARASDLRRRLHSNSKTP